MSRFRLVAVAVSVSTVFNGVIAGTLTVIITPTPVNVLKGASDPILQVITLPLTGQRVPLFGIEHPKNEHEIFSKTALTTVVFAGAMSVIVTPEAVFFCVKLTAAMK